MRPALLRSVTLILLALAAHCAAARADVLRVIASDARGVTLQVTTEAWSLSAPGPDGRVHVVGVPDAHSLADPGHALVPAYSTMLAVPPDAHPSVRVVSADAAVVRGGVRLAIARQPSFTPGEHGEYEPGSIEVPARTDGVWPLEQVQLGTVNSFRGRRLVGLEVRPFQYDEATATLRATASLVVRVDFNRPAASAAMPVTVSAPDPHADPVLRAAVLNFDQAEPWRVAPAGTASPLFARPGSGRAAGQPFDETQPEVRITVDSTGVWVLTYAQLAASGFPVGTPIAQVSVHRHEFIESGGSQPYETIDVPIEVEDADGNGVFDHDDRIWVYVRNWAARSGASQYQRWWGDAEVIYATVKPAGGLRMATREGWRGSASPTLLTSYPAFQHWEQNFAFMMPNITAATDTNTDVFQWTGQAFYYDRQDSIGFSANNIDTTHTVKFAVNWVGRDDQRHNDWAAVKNKLGQLTTIADSVVWDGKYAVTRTGTTLGSALSEGLNKLVLWGRPGSGPPDGTAILNDLAGLDWFEATYWRRFVAVHDVLTFNTAGQSGELQVHASGFGSDSCRVYDVTDPENPVRVHVDEAHVQRVIGVALDLQDSVATGVVHNYVIAAANAAADGLDPTSGPRAPAADHVAAVTRLSLGTKTAGDYVMVVPEAFLPAMQPLVTLRQSLGMQVVVATAEDVYDEFNGGRHSAMALRRFAKYAYNHWNARFLLLVGDGTLDPKNYGGLAGPDWIPVNPVPGPVRVPEGYEITVSDNLYGCITGNCDPIYSSGTVIPELMIGRLPVNSLADAQAVVSKLVGYENLTGDQTWRRHLLLCSDDAFSSSTGPGFGVLGAGLLLAQRRGVLRGPEPEGPLHRAARRRPVADERRELEPALLPRRRGDQPALARRHVPPGPAGDAPGHARRRDAAVLLAHERRHAVVELPGPRERVRADARGPVRQQPGLARQRRQVPVRESQSVHHLHRVQLPREHVRAAERRAAAAGRARGLPRRGHGNAAGRRRRRVVGVRLLRGGPERRFEPHQRRAGARHVRQPAARSGAVGSRLAHRAG
jgi:hypothetical protein